MDVESGLLGLNEVSAIPKRQTFSGSPDFGFRDDRTDFVEPSSCSIAMRRSLLRLSREINTLGVVSG